MAEPNGGNGLSRVFKDVPATIWIFLVGQLIATIIWGVRLDGRVSIIERKQEEAARVVEDFKTVLLRITIVEERQRMVLERLSDMRKMDDDLRKDVERIKDIMRLRSIPTMPP